MLKLEEKKWVDSINSGKYKSVKDFLYTNSAAEFINLYGSTDLVVNLEGDQPFGEQWRRLTFQHGQKIWGLGTSKTVIFKSIDFAKLLKKMEEEGLITRTGDPNFDLKELPYFKVKGNTLVLNELAEILKDFSMFQLTPRPSLETFIHLGYKTDRELVQEENEKRVKKAEKRSFWVSILIPVVAILIQLLLAYWQYKTYDKQRDVKILNPKEFRDTIVVKMEDNRFDRMQKEIDSLKVLHAQMNRASKKQK